MKGCTRVALKALISQGKNKLISISYITKSTGIRHSNYLLRAYVSVLELFE